MKTNSLRKPFKIPVLLAIITAWGLSVLAAQAFTVTLQQVGSNVVATGSGAIDLTGLSFLSAGEAQAFMDPKFAIMHTGSLALDSTDLYTGFSGPTTFGSGRETFASSGSGDKVSIDGSDGFLGVPTGYVSGSPLSDTSIYDNATFMSLGVTPGTYVWSWGTGVNQNFTLETLAPAGVPDSGSTFGLLLLALIALFGASRLRYPWLA